MPKTAQRFDCVLSNSEFKKGKHQFKMHVCQEVNKWVDLWTHFWWTVRIQRNISLWCLTRKTLRDMMHTVSSASLHFIKCELSMNSAYSCNCVFMKLCIFVLLLKTFKVYQYWSLRWHSFCESFIYLLLWFEHFIHAYYMFWSVTPLVPSSNSSTNPNDFFSSISWILFLNLMSTESCLFAFFPVLFWTCYLLY